jgi:[acyl-carrier-protein] S-malonyltransferase
MQADLAENYGVVAEVYAEASAVLGYDLWQLVQDGPVEKLGETTVTQPAMLAAGFAAWRVWNAVNGEKPTHVAGHSLGEYTALAAAGAVSFADAMRVVKRRAELMQDAVPVGVGAMAAILGLDDDAVARVCEQAAAGEVAEAVNFNAPGQVVIAGHKTAIDRAIELAKEAGARRALPLPVSVPAHSQLMRPAGEALADALAATEFRAPQMTVISASDAVAYGDGDDIRQRLSRQVYSPVQWVNTVNALTAAGASTLVEAGPGKVLAGLVRRIDKTTPVATIDSIAGLEKALGE